MNRHFRIVPVAVSTAALALAIGSCQRQNEPKIIEATTDFATAEALRQSQEYARQLEVSAQQTQHFERQLERTDQQLQRNEAVLKRNEEQLERAETLLKRQEKQADRYDKLLDRWEAEGRPKERQ
jgi:hypothetical protein